MLIAVLLTPRTGTALESVRALGEVVWSRVREPAAADPRQEFAELTRTAADVILLDADAAPADALMAGVRQLRLLHRARVLVLAPGAQPGHRGIDLLVGLGVYDILAPHEPEPDWAALIGQALSGPPSTYAHAARWHVSAAPPEPAAGGGGDSQGGGRERVRVVRQVERVIERVPLAGRPVVVAVAAVAPGLGATFAAMAAAGHLARQGHRAAVVEASGRPCLAAMLAAMGHPPADPGGVEAAPGVTVYAQPAYAVPPSGWSPRGDGLRLARGLLAAGRERHEYVVLDLGAVGPDDPELARADLGIVVVGAAPWRLRDLHQWFADATGVADASMPHWRYVQTPADHVDPVLEMAAEELGTRAMALPWIPPELVPGYQGGSETATAALGALLEPVLLRPGEAPSRGRFAAWTARRAARRAAKGAAGAARGAARAAALVLDMAVAAMEAGANAGRWLLDQWLLVLGFAVVLAILAGAGVPLGPLEPVADWVRDAGRRVLGTLLSS